MVTLSSAVTTVPVIPAKSLPCTVIRGRNPEESGINSGILIQASNYIERSSPPEPEP